MESSVSQRKHRKRRYQTMKSVRLADLKLAEGRYESDDSVQIDFVMPLTPGTPGASEVVAEDFVVVYFELDPGKRLGTHIDSEEEILLVMKGSVTVAVGDDEGTLSAGEMVVVPQKEPHSVRNTGDEPAAVVGFFPEGEVHHEFDEPVMPFGTREFVTKPEASS
jgi:quercetin dioxygenase-like cupin family protein